MSARNESISSAGVREGSEVEEGSRRDVARAGSSGRLAAAGAGGREGGVLSVGADEGDSKASFLAFSFSRSVALSLAALVAAGKYWAKLPLEGRVIATGPAATEIESSPHRPSCNHHNARAEWTGIVDAMKNMTRRVAVDGARRGTRAMKKGGELKWELFGAAAASGKLAGFQ